MSTSRLFSLFVVVTLVVLAGLTVRTGIAMSQVAASSQSAAAQLTDIDGASRPNLHDSRQVASASTLMLSAPNFTSPTLIRQTRDAIRARWMARFGATHRTCVLLCGGQ